MVDWNWLFQRGHDPGGRTRDRSPLPEIRSGTVADAASVKLPKRIPYHIAMELLLTGRWFDAEEANRWGLVNEIIPADQLMDRAWELARLLASGPPLVYAAIKEVVRDAEDSASSKTR